MDCFKDEMFYICLMVTTKQKSLEESQTLRKETEHTNMVNHQFKNVDRHTHTMEYYSAIKNKTMPFAATWMDLESVIQSEVSQKEKNKYHIFTHICGT